MVRLYIMVGAPCSGKSTLADKMLKDDMSLVRVNKDSYRYMLRNQGMLEPKLETFLGNEQLLLIDKLVDKGYSVIVDNTHCKVKYIKQLEDRLKDKAVIQMILLDRPLWLLMWRNVKRYITKGIWIPRFVIKNMKKNLKEVKTYLGC